MKFYPALLIILLLPAHLFSQSLTIKETINYLNDLSLKNPFTYILSGSDCDHSCSYKFFITEEGLITVYQLWAHYNCKVNTVNVKRENKYGTFNVNDVDIDDIKLEIDCNGKEIDFDCITEYYEQDNIEGRLKTRSLEFLTSTNYNKNRFRNALNYLLTSAKEKYPRKYDKDDPFVSPQSQNDSVVKKSIKPETEYKISLKEENGVFSLTVNTGGIVSRFILDSGAGESNISSGLESKLIANGTIKQKDYLSNGLYRLADGSIVECKRVKLSKVTVGSKTVYNVIASIGLENSPNLLGQSFLNKTNSWTIDNSKRILIIK